MPVLMRPQRLLEALALLGGLTTSARGLPAALSTRSTLEGLTATTSASRIMYASRR